MDGFKKSSLTSEKFYELSKSIQRGAEKIYDNLDSGHYIDPQGNEYKWSFPMGYAAIIYAGMLYIRRYRDFSIWEKAYESGD